MPMRNRKKIIIGYRYDPESNSMERLRELHAVDEGDFNFSENSNSVKKKERMPPESQIVRQLKNENLLLKAQIQRLSQKSALQSYQQLAQSHQHLQKQCAQLKQRIQQLQQQIISIENKYISLKGEKSTKHSSQQVPTADRNDAWKYTFSPYHASSVDQRVFNGVEKLNQGTGKYPSFKELSTAKKEMPSLNESFVNKILSERFLESEPERQTSFAHLNHYQQLGRQVFHADKSLQHFEGVPNKYFQGINSDYMYNDLPTIESSKSQQLESIVQMDLNFSFMPKPLKKNSPSIKVLTSTNKKVSFNEDVNLLYSDKEFCFSNKSRTENGSQPSLAAEIKGEEIGSRSGLSGLKKLPDKPVRTQSRLSDPMRDL